MRYFSLVTYYKLTRFVHFFGSGPVKKKKLDWVTRLKIALGAAQGLSYLHHDCNPRIIHRDIKSSNILLDKDFEAHLTDFGIAKSLCVTKSYTSTYVLGTIGYIDPEYARTSRLTNLHHLVSHLSLALCSRNVLKLLVFVIQNPPSFRCELKLLEIKMFKHCTLNIFSPKLCYFHKSFMSLISNAKSSPYLFSFPTPRNQMFI